LITFKTAILALLPFQWKNINGDTKKAQCHFALKISVILWEIPLPFITSCTNHSHSTPNSLDRHLTQQLNCPHTRRAAKCAMAFATTVVLFALASTTTLLNCTPRINLIFARWQKWARATIKVNLTAWVNEAGRLLLQPSRSRPRRTHADAHT
jgi:hypothetical protein